MKRTIPAKPRAAPTTFPKTVSKSPNDAGAIQKYTILANRFDQAWIIDYYVADGMVREKIFTPKNVFIRATIAQAAKTITRPIRAAVI